MRGSIGEGAECTLQWLRNDYANLRYFITQVRIAFGFQFNVSCWTGYVAHIATGDQRKRLRRRGREPRISAWREWRPGTVRKDRGDVWRSLRRARRSRPESLRLELQCGRSPWWLR